MNSRHEPMDEDQIFWDRLEEMPDLEAEQELVLRRLIVIRENAELASQKSGDYSRRGVELGLLISANAAQLSLINERLKMIRKRMDRADWKNAVLALYGQEGYEKCRAWIIQEEQG